jgi:heme exporter protein C
METTTGIQEPPASSRDIASIAKTLLLAVSGVMMLADMALIFLWVPTEQVMGVVQRVFYFHMPLAWTGLLAPTVVFVASIMYLWKGQRRWDAIAHSAGELSVMLITLTIISGATWAKMAWGVWWTWEPRLTTTLILWLMYMGYLMLRAYAPTPSLAARYSAVMGIIAFIDVPIVYFSVNWWRGIHPRVVGVGAASGSLDSDMLITLIFSVFTFTTLFTYVLWDRVSLRNAEDAVQGMRIPERTA